MAAVDIARLPGPQHRVDALPWKQLGAELDAQGHATVSALLSRAECDSLIALYPQQSAFRKRIVMAQHGFGSGEYQYFNYPLPSLVARLRSALYEGLAPIANDWAARSQPEVSYPLQHSDYLARCHAAGQVRPTPLLLRYAVDDYNCLHQDLYGAQVFPLQVAVLLSEPGCDFTGGEFVLTEQRPRRQSRVEVVALQRGDAVLFAVHHRPVRGTRGSYRVTLRHGVSRIRCGSRHTLGIIFHDAT